MLVQKASVYQAGFHQTATCLAQTIVNQVTTVERSANLPTDLATTAACLGGLSLSVTFAATLTVLTASAIEQAIALEDVWMNCLDISAKRIALKLVMITLVTEKRVTAQNVTLPNQRLSVATQVYSSMGRS